MSQRTVPMVENEPQNRPHGRCPHGRSWPVGDWNYTFSAFCGKILDTLVENDKDLGNRLFFIYRKEACKWASMHSGSIWDPLI